MSSLRSALDELDADDLRFMTDEELEDDLLELERANSVLYVQRLRRLPEVERRRTYLRDGYLSASVWLAQRAQTSHAEAKHHVGMARALEQMPATRAALGDGEVTQAAARVLVEARETNPEEFPAVEETLADAARALSIRELRAVAAHWQQAAERLPGEEREERLHERRRLHLSPSANGMIRADGDFGPEGGQTVISAVQAMVDADVRGATDMRTPGQRRADALVELCRQYLDRADRPSVAGERPHLTVTVDLETLEGRGARAHFDDAGRVSAETVRRIACDASISRLITRGRTEPLEVGRRTSVVPAGLRRAVVLRDGRCRFPGCDRPQSWCDAHHVVHWADGGETSLSNLVLLCRPHHRLVHQGFGIEAGDGSFRFNRPDGTLLEDRAPP